MEAAGEANMEGGGARAGIRVAMGARGRGREGGIGKMRRKWLDNRLVCYGF